MNPSINMTGRRIGRLVVLARAGNTAGKARWLCQCDCGRQHTAIGANLRNGMVRSCGCLRGVRAVQRGTGQPTKRYAPLDDVLERTSVRLLRALQRFDGVTCEDLLDALDIEEEKQRWAGSARLRGMRKYGLVSRESDLYRITNAGRVWLAKQIARADVGVATEEEAA